MLDQMADDVHAKSRKLDKTKPSIYSSSDRERAQEYLGYIEDLASEGFNRKNMEYMLRMVKAYRPDAIGFYTGTEAALKKALAEVPAFRAKWAKEIMSTARRYHRQVNDMYYKSTMEPLTADIHQEDAVKKTEGLDDTVVEAKKKPVPTDPSKWSYAKSQAKKKYDVYPSAYANAWAAKKYKELGGGWRMGTKEDIEEMEQLEELKCWPGYERVPGTKAGEVGSCRKKGKKR